MSAMNIYALIMSGMIIFFALILSEKNDVLINKIVFAISIIMLVFNIYRLLYPVIVLDIVAIPIEFSAVSYIIVPIIFLFKIKKLKAWATYASMMAGVFYFLVVILNGSNTYGDYPVYDVQIAIFNHGAFLFLAVLKLKTIKFEKKEFKTIIIGLLSFSIYAFLLRPLNADTERIFIYEVMDAKYIYDIFPYENTFILAIVFYIFLILALFLTIKVFYWLNKNKAVGHM